MAKKPKKEMDSFSPEEAIEFLEDFRKLVANIDEPTKPVSIRIPANILRAVKYQARTQKTKYQSLIVEYIREGLAKQHSS